MDFDGLSVDQAPPIWAPLRFFLTAPLFAILAACLLFFGDATSFMSRYSMESIVTVHAITIGFFSLVMLGALTQMLPVLAGVKIPSVLTLAKLAHFAISIGLVLMIFGLLKSISWMIFASSALIGVGFLLLLLPMLFAFKKVANITSSVKAIAVSLVFATLSVFMGAHLLASHGSGHFSQFHTALANVHSVWAIFGFAGVLIIGVAFHVLPMFYVAPRFKKFCKKRVVWLITLGLFLWLVLNFVAVQYATIAKIWIALFFWAFATTVFLKLNARRRPISDVTVWYWRSATIFMTLGVFAWTINDYFDEAHIAVVAVLIGGGFLFSIILGMLYKIVPFLIWFHLNARGYMSIPSITEMIDKRFAKIQFVLFVVSLIGFIAAYFYNAILPSVATVFGLSMVILEYNLLSAVKIYNNTLKKKPEFDMSMFSLGGGS